MNTYSGPPRAVWRWRITRLFESVGRNGWLGLAALLLAALIALTVLRGMWQRHQALDEEISDLRQGKLKEHNTANAARLPALLPGASAAAEFANLLNNLAGRTGVHIDRMEYQLQRESGKPVLLYRAELVAIAPYLNLRSWLDAVLAERPTAAIDEVVFERPNADAPDVVARVRLVLFMKGEP